MEEKQRQLGKIEAAEIVIEDHGILTINIRLGGDGWSQGLPSLCFDWHDSQTKEHGYSRTMAKFLREIMDTFGVWEFKKLIGLPCYVIRKDGQFITALESVKELGYSGKQFVLADIMAEGRKEMDERGGE